MNLTKKLLASSISAVFAASALVPAANADIELGEGLTVTGFVDMSYVYTDVDGADEGDEAFGVDQVEIDFIYTGADGVSAQVDIEYGESSNDDGADDTFVEQAFITKQLSDSFSVKAGRFLSYSGWETEEPTGLYQYSGTGYGGLFYGGYQQGVSAYYDGGVVDLMASVVNSAFDPTDSDSESLAMEFGIAVMPMEELTMKAFYISDDETDLINLWASYAVSSWTFAVEYNMGEYADDVEADGFLVMGNYAADAWGITVRYHDYTQEMGSTTLMENSALTIAPSFIVSDNLAIITEYRMDEWGDDAESSMIAVEALYTF